MCSNYVGQQNLGVKPIDTTTKALEGGALAHINKVLLAKFFYKEQPPLALHKTAQHQQYFSSHMS